MDKNQWIGGCLALVLMITASMAAAGTSTADSKDLSKAVEKVNYVETDVSGVKLSGYVDVGYIYNFDSGVRSQGYATDRNARGDFNVNAVKFTVEKELTDENKLQAGFRTDLMFGEDAQGFTSTYGSGASTLYLQQAYVIFRLPYGNGIDIQLGQMNSIMGFEADERPANMNITQGSNAWLDPGPSAGVLITYPVTDIAKVLFGINNGSGAPDGHSGFDRESDSYTFNAALNLQNKGGNVETQIGVQYSPWGDSAVSAEDDNTATIGLNWWGTWAPKCANDKLLLALNASLWNATNVDPVAHDSATFITGALYAKYQFTELFSLAGRAEYTHTNDSADVIFGDGIHCDDFYSLTLTAGFNLAENLMLRAEYRCDLGNNVTNNGGDTGHGVSLETVFTF